MRHRSASFGALKSPVQPNDAKTILNVLLSAFWFYSIIIKKETSNVLWSFHCVGSECVKEGGGRRRFSNKEVRLDQALSKTAPSVLIEAVQLRNAQLQSRYLPDCIALGIKKYNL